MSKNNDNIVNKFYYITKNIAALITTPVEQVAKLKIKCRANFDAKS